MSGTQLLPPERITLPLLPLRDVVVFPHMVIPLFVGRPKSIKALEAAMEGGKHIMLVAQKTAAKDEPTEKDMYEVGCIANILQMLKLPDGTVKVLVEGLQRPKTLTIEEQETQFSCDVMPLEPDHADSAETEALRRAIVSQFDQYVKLNKKIPPEILTSLSGIDEAGRLADTIAAHLPLKLDQKQHILEMLPVVERLEHLLAQLEAEIDILQVEKRIRGRVKRQMEKSQREYYLNEQVKAIQKELGEGEEGADLEELEKRITNARMPKEAKKKADAELKKLKLMSPMSAEATVVRNYIDTLIGLPWRKKSKVNNDLTNAERVLDEDHFGLEKVKERILEYLAVQQRVEKVKAPILCLVGPRASARPRWASRSPAQRTVNSCAWRSAACMTSPRFAVTVARILGRCPARSCRAWRKSACAIRFSCSTKSTRWAWISAATRRPRCLRCSIRNRTIRSPITTSRSISICRT